MRRKNRTFHHRCASTFQMLETEFCFLSLGFSVRTLHYKYNPLCYLVGILCFFLRHFLVCSFQVGSSFLCCKRPYRLCTSGLPLIQSINLHLRVSAMIPSANSFNRFVTSLTGKRQHPSFLLRDCTHSER